MKKRLNNKYYKISMVMALFALICTIGILWNGEEVYETFRKEKAPCIIIDSGHGGVDPGKVSATNVYEKDINLQIGLRLKEIFEKKNYRVIMTREEDVGLYREEDTNKKMADLKKRVALINEAQADAVISIHQNSYSDARVKGAQVFYLSGASEGETLAKIIQNRFVTEVDDTNQRSAKGNDQYYLLKNISSPMVIVECGFLSNPQEAKNLCEPSYQKKVANAICGGVQAYIEQKKGNAESDEYKDSAD